MINLFVCLYNDNSTLDITGAYKIIAINFKA